MEENERDVKISTEELATCTVHKRNYKYKRSVKTLHQKIWNAHIVLLFFGLLTAAGKYYRLYLGFHTSLPSFYTQESVQTFLHASMILHIYNHIFKNWHEIILSCWFQIITA
jgi:hypothetical protein